MEGEISISLPNELVDKLKRKYEKAGFDSVSKYVAYILKEVLSNMGDEGNGEENAYSKEEEAEVEKKLKALGYL